MPASDTTQIRMVADMSAAAQGQSELVQLLRRFNRKERYWLLVDALGPSALHLSDDYRQRLGQILGVLVPADAWWAMDYHFDWLHAALFCLAHGVTPEDLGVQCNEGKAVKGNQEDMDLIVAFDRTLLLIEAKGAGAWSQAQMESKSQRIAALPQPEGLDLRLVLTSPPGAQNIMSGQWVTVIQKSMPGSAGNPLLMPLNGFGGGERLLRVARCDIKGRPDARGDCWGIQSQPKSPPAGVDDVPA